MDTFASLMTDAMIDALIGKHAKFHEGETVHCKANQRKAVIIAVIYDDKTDGIYYDIKCQSRMYHAIPECLLTAIG